MAAARRSPACSAEPGYERALAAALGEDADAAVGGDAPRRWQGSDVLAGDPGAARRQRSASPIMCKRRTELLRRLKQVAVADEDNGQPLAVGPAAGHARRAAAALGRVRRDGVGRRGGRTTAARQPARRLADELPGLDAAVETRVGERDRALAAMEQCRERGRGGADAALAAERDAREAARAIDAATAALERIEAQRASLEQRHADLEPVLGAASEARCRGGAVACRPARSRGDRAARSKRRAKRRRRQLRQSPTSAPRPRPRRARPRPIVSGRARQDASNRNGASVWRDAEQRLAATVERQKQQAAERAELRQEPAELDQRIVELEHANEQSQVRIGEAAAAERETEEAVVEAAQAVSAANERSADTRERRAAAAARAEAQQARSAEFARAAVDKFEMVPQRLPEKLGFDTDEPRNADEEAATLERLTAERERIGPVNLVAEAGARRARRGAQQGRRRSRGADPGDPSAARLDRQSQSRGARPAARSLSRWSTAISGDCSRPCSRAARRISSWSRATIRWRLGWRSWRSRRASGLSTLTLLSGGEQALTAVALIFAIFLTNPAPICVLDEVDAPLDDANVERFCELLQRMTQETDTRYLIVTHNAVTMSRMDRLYGVTMIEKGVSRLVSVDLGSAETLLAAE